MAEGMIGRTFGAYTVTGFLDRGGMATVWQGYHAALDRNVAIKVMAADMLEDENFLKRFGNEARLLAKLQHPHILPIYDFGEANGVPYIVMPLMSDSLRKRMRAGEPLTLEAALPILTAIGQALDFAHTQGVLHRDIKPNNVLFDQHNNPFLADFGIARAMQASRGLTGTGILGTLEYMSPEQARGDALDGRSDVYSFGIMTHQILTGHLAFSSTTPAGMLFKHISEPPRPPREFNPALPATVDQILLKVLAKDPNDRYQTASEFTRALSEAHAGVVSHTPTAQVVAALTREAEPITPAYTPPQPQRLATGPVPVPPIATGSVPPIAAKSAGGNSYLPWLIGCGVVALLGCLGLGGMALIAPTMLGLGDSTATPRPTERPDTPTPTPRRPTATPRPTFTPQATEAGNLPNPNILFEDDFSNEDSGWGHSTDESGSLEYENGEYVFRVVTDNYITWGVLDDEEFENIRVVVEVAELNEASDDQPTFGVMCQYQDDENYYYAGFGTDGYYAIIKYEDSQDIFLSDPAENLWQYTEEIPPDQASYQLEVECANGQIKLVVDGKTISEVEDDTFTFGQIGLFVLTFDVPEAHVAFDNLQVFEVPSP